MTYQEAKSRNRNIPETGKEPPSNKGPKIMAVHRKKQKLWWSHVVKWDVDVGIQAIFLRATGQ